MKLKVNLLDLTVSELRELISDAGYETYRASQVYQWLTKGVKNMDEMANIPKNLREELKKVAHTGNLRIIKKLVSKIDGTVKYLFELNDGNVIESVLMKYRYGLSICISTQVGCRMGCKFCASAGAGFIRNLSSGEMLGQIISTQKDVGKRIGHIVVMGIGEPLDNYDNLVKFLRTINLSEGLNIGYRHITVSTCGLVPEILKLSKENVPISLSISLHAPNDEIRRTIMPIGKKYSIDKIIEACKIYTEITRRRVTFEYAMIEGVNDSRKNAAELSRRIKGMLCHVNLRPVNIIEGVAFKRSERKKIEDFKAIIEGYGIKTTIRRKLGADINAACGQLRRSVTG
jgi:23S rRNA (adenine2503-C2)-methyltransferase